jgi:capsular exopolysaccharide synthesis family protein
MLVPASEAGANGVALSPKQAQPMVLTQQMPTMSMLLKGLRRSWLRAVVFGPIVAAVVALAIWFFLPLPKNSARSILYVPEENPFILFPDHVSRQDYLGYKKTQATLVKSREVLSAALHDPKIASLPLVRQKSDPIEWLERDLKVDFSAGPEVLTVTLNGDRDEEMAQVVNAIVSAYLEVIVTKDHTSRFDRIDQLEKLKAKYSKRLTDSRDTLNKLVESTGTRDPANMELQQKINLEMLAAAHKDLTQMQSEVRSLQVDIKLESQRAGIADFSGFMWSSNRVAVADDEKIPEGLFNEALQKDPVIEKQTKRLNELQATLDEIKRVAPDRFDQLSRRERSELESVQKTIKSRREEARKTIEPQIREKLRNDRQKSIAAKTERLQHLVKLEEQLKSDVRRLDDRTREIGKNSVDLERLRGDIAEDNDILKKVNFELEALKAEKEAPIRIRVLEKAVISRPDRQKLQVAATCIGAIGTLGLVFFGLGWWEFRALRIDSAEQVTRQLGVSVMATLPLLPAKRRNVPAGSSSPSEDEWNSLLVESVDSLRTILLHVARTDSLRVVMVTSALEGEGKTSLSSQLATSLARAGRNTLLVDGDMRQPSLHRVFGLPDSQGLCEVLRGEVPVADVIRPSGLSGLSVITGGACDDFALGALARGEVARLLDQLRERFDFILVDSAPVLSVADSLLLAQDVDGVLFAIMEDVSRLGPVYMAHERLASLGVRMLGAIVVGTPQVNLYSRTARYLARGMRIETPQQPVAEEAP